MKACAGILICLLILGAASSEAANPQLSLVPASTTIFRDSSLLIWVDVDAASVNLKAYSIELQFNRNFIRTDSLHVTEGLHLASAGRPTFFWTHFSPDSGHVFIDGAVLGDGFVVNGAGTLAQIEFQTIGFGETDVEVVSLRARDANNQPLVYDINNGWVKVCQFVGDVNADNRISIADCVYLINWIFNNGPGPIPDPLVGDVDCNGTTSIADCVYIINYIFNSGPSPCGPCY